MLLADAPLVESVQVAPRVAGSEILVETKLKNPGPAPVTFELRQAVKAWKGGGLRREGRRDADHAGGRRVEGRAADDQGRGRAPVVARGPVPLRPRHLDRRRRLGQHPLRHARVPLRHGHAPRVPERPAVLPARLERHAPPFLRGPGVGCSAVGRGLGATAPRRPAEEAPLERLPLLHRPGARQVAGRRRRGRAPHPERVLRVDRRPGLGAVAEPHLRRAGDGPAVLRLDARQLEPPERCRVGRQQRDEGRALRREDRPRGPSPRPLEPQLGEQLQPAGGPRRPGRGPPVPARVRAVGRPALRHDDAREGRGRGQGAADRRPRGDHQRVRLALGAPRRRADRAHGRRSTSACSAGTPRRTSGSS